MSLLTDDDRKSIEEAIKAAEAKTSGEIVFAVIDASSHYHHATLQGALIGMAGATAIFLALPILHTVVAVLWVEFISFALFSAVLPRIPWRRWFIPGREMDARVHQAALAEFYSSGLYRTRESNGILIFLSCLERRVVVLGDKAIHEKIGSQWDDVRDKIIRGIRDGRPREGIVAAIEGCGRSLAEHFPHRSDDIHELPDSVIDRTLKPDAP